ncbi:MAG: DUF960 domain-containing protein [Oscillospiraceae bacterium]|nr:DUF960 domain-containing protein [Oscillospiraceae bacterium]
MFNNQRYATKGITAEIPMLTQIILWNIIDTMPEPKDGFQVFKLSERNGLQVIEHHQEIPEYRKDYEIKADEIVSAKIFVIDDGTHSTMLLAEEY